MTILFANNATTEVAGSITSTSTSVNVASGDGALFPNPGPNDFFCATFYNAVSADLYEIVHVTNRSGDTMTIVRGQEGTQAQSWNAGDTFSALITAGSLGNFLQTGSGLNTSIVYEGVDVGPANHLEVPTLTPTPNGNPIDGMIVLVTLGSNSEGPCDISVLGQSPLPIEYAGGRALDPAPTQTTQIGNKWLLVNQQNASYRLINLPHANDPGSVHTGIDTGSAANTVIANPTYPPAQSYNTGQLYAIYIAHTNTGDTWAAFDGLSGLHVRRPNGDILHPGDIVSGQIAVFSYNPNTSSDAGGCLDLFCGNMVGAPGAQGPAGPAGPTVVSAEANNLSRLGTDGYLYTPGISPFSPQGFGWSPAGDGLLWTPGISTDGGNILRNGGDHGLYVPTISGWSGYGGVGTVCVDPNDVSFVSPSSRYGGTWSTMQTDYSQSPPNGPAANTVDICIVPCGTVNSVIWQRVV